MVTDCAWFLHLLSSTIICSIIDHMLKKKELTKILYDALDSEEEANTHFYTYTIKSLKYYKWLSEDKRERVANIMKKLGGDSQRHKSMVENLIQNVGESKKNVF